jgi:hypothetical protein
MFVGGEGGQIAALQAPFLKGDGCGTKLNVCFEQNLTKIYHLIFFTQFRVVGIFHWSRGDSKLPTTRLNRTES